MPERRKVRQGLGAAGGRTVCYAHGAAANLRVLKQAGVLSASSVARVASSAARPMLRVFLRS